MKVLVDTSIWSLALRRSPRSLTLDQTLLNTELAELVREGRATMIGPVRQELLSGFSREGQFERLKALLQFFEDAELFREDYEEAARIHNECRRAGISGSDVDFLLCAVARRREWSIFTYDRDFWRYAGHIAIRLHEPRTSPP